MGVVSSRHRRLETHSLVTGERRGHSVGTLRQGELVKGRRLQGRKKVSPSYNFTASFASIFIADFLK